MLPDLVQFLEDNALWLGVVLAALALGWAVYAHYSRKPQREGTRQQITSGDENI